MRLYSPGVEHHQLLGRAAGTHVASFFPPGSFPGSSGGQPFSFCCPKACQGNNYTDE